jgi:hypothetical protein
VTNSSLSLIVQFIEYFIIAANSSTPQVLMSPTAPHVNITLETVEDNSKISCISFTLTIDLEVMVVTQQSAHEKVYYLYVINTVYFPSQNP